MIFMTVKIGQEKRAHEDLILGDAPLLQQETEDDAKYKPQHELFRGIRFCFFLFLGVPSFSVQ
jgi:hypothetical protein